MDQISFDKLTSNAKNSANQANDSIKFVLQYHTYADPIYYFKIFSEVIIALHLSINHLLFFVFCRKWHEGQDRVSILFHIQHLPLTTVLLLRAEMDFPFTP